MKKFFKNLSFASLRMKLGIVLIGFVVLVQILGELNRGNLVFKSFEVPVNLQKAGYSGIVITNHILDEVLIVRKIVHSQNKSSGIQVEAADTMPEVVLPGADLSVKQFFHYIRKFLGNAPVAVSGDVVIKDHLELTIRITGRQQARFKGDPNNLDPLFQDAAEYILRKVDPLTIARYYVQKKQIGQMESLAEEVWKDKSTSKEKAQSMIIQGWVDQEQNNHEDAARKFERAIQYDKKNTDAYNNWGNSLRNLGREEEAIQKYKKALELDSDYASPYNNWGVILEKQKKYSEAILKYQKAIELNPNNAHSYKNWANLLINQGKYEEAIEKYKIAVVLDPYYADAFINWGLLLYEQGQIEEAVQKYKTALKIDPNSADVYSNLGLALEGVGKEEEAKKNYETAIQLDSHDLSANYNLAVLLYNQGKREQSLQYFKNVLGIDENYGKAHSSIGDILFQDGKLEEALLSYQRAIQLSPKNVDLYFRAGYAYHYLDQPKEAIAYFEKAVLLDGDGDVGAQSKGMIQIIQSTQTK